MTRKQALMRVCEILSTYEDLPEKDELLQKVGEVIHELPLTGWSEATIFDTIDQWIYEHGRIPSTKDMARKGLPPIPVIKNRFGINAAEFLHKYYPKDRPLCNSERYGDKTVEEWSERFVREYNRIKPIGAVDFNKRRPEGFPTWRTFARLLGLSKWNELLNHLNISKPKKQAERGRKSTSTPIVVKRTIDADELIAQLDRAQ